MLKVAVVALKGGSGKTTLAKSLGVAAELKKKKAVIVDLDPQGSALVWAERRGEDVPPEVVAAPAPMLGRTLERAEKAGFDIALLDTPPKLSDTSGAAAEGADIVLIPCRPTQDDIDTLAGTRRLLRAATQAPTFVVLNQCPPAKVRVEEARATILESDAAFEVCPLTLGHRTAFVDASILGQTPQEFDPRSTAADEIAALYKWLMKQAKALH